MTAGAISLLPCAAERRATHLPPFAFRLSPSSFRPHSLSWLHHQPRYSGGICLALQREHRVAELLDLLFRQDMTREILEFRHDFGLAGDLLLAARDLDSA